MLDIKRVLAAKPKEHEPEDLIELTTPWGEALDAENVLPEHPRPQFARDRYRVLNGWWDYAIVPCADACDAWKSAPAPEQFDGRILVPFSPEAPLSEVRRQLKPDELLWYRASIAAPRLADGERCILHFDAVDYACALYCNGEQIGTHVGGYLPFSFDITSYIGGGSCELTLCVFDPSETGTQLRGKQCLKRGNIWYTAQSGIWKTVWLEVVPESYIDCATIDARPGTGMIAIEAKLVGRADRLSITAYDAAGKPVGTHAWGYEELELDGNVAHVQLSIGSPHLWSCDDPYLYSLAISYGNDMIHSYCAFRLVEVKRDGAGKPRFFLNGEPLLVRGVLDQSYWPDGLMTPPSDKALVFDIAEMRDLGFNMLRMHIKVECERWYYHCDRMGMLVWQDMVSGGGTYNDLEISHIPTLWRRSWTHRGDGVKRYEKLSANDPAYRDEWRTTCFETVKYLRNHPCIVTWVLFNEGWGQFDARDAATTVQALDPTRPIDATSGWFDQRCGSYFSVHDYFRDLRVYRDPAAHGRHPLARAFALSEFGGLTYHVDGHSSLSRAYGYDTYEEAGAWADAVLEHLAIAETMADDGLAAYVFTQLSDIEEETNGLLTYDRRINKLKNALAHEDSGNLIP